MIAPDPPKKPRTAPPEVRRKQLIEATITCIARKGISGTTLNAIATEAGLSLGLANFHFKSKDALLSETLKHLAAEHRDMWLHEVQRGDLTDAEKLRSIVSSQFHPHICCRKKLAVWFAFFGEASHRETYRSISSRIDMERQEICTELCAAIIGQSTYAQVDADEVAQTLEGMFDGLWLNILMYPDQFTPARAHTQVMNYLGLVFPAQFAT